MNFKMNSKLLFLAGCAVLALSAGCSGKRMYNEAYGFADVNPEAYDKDLHACKEEAYARFPPQGFSPSFYSQAPLYYGGGFPGPVRGRYRYGRHPFGMSGYFSRLEAAREERRARQEAAEVMEEYNQARRDAVRYCMQDKGWRELEAEKAKAVSGTDQ